MKFNLKWLGMVLNFSSISEVVNLLEYLLRGWEKFKFALCNFTVHCHASFLGLVLVRVRITGNSSDFSLTPLPFSHSGQTEK